MDQSNAKLELRKLLAAACRFTGITAFCESSASPSWRILTYHRVTAPESEEFVLQPGMFVRPETFKAQMAFLQQHAICIPLDELLSGLSSGKTFEPRTVAITFDDGWLDNYRNAFPVLKALGLPATIFLATDYIGTNEYFWTDRIAQVLGALAGRTQYREQILGRLWEKHEPPQGLRQAVEGAVRSGNVSLQDVDNIIELLKSRPPLERQQTVNNLWLLAKEFATVKSERLFMNWEEVNEMDRAGITFGSHSHRHQPLSELSAPQLRDELLESYQALRTHGLTPSAAFCYPGGYSNDESQRALRGADISFALATVRDSRLDTEPALLGRVNIHQDMTSTISLFRSRVWGPALFFSR